MSTRLEVLQSTRLLDSPPEAAFDRLTRLAGSLLGGQASLVSLVDQTRQFFKSAWGLGEPWASRRETPISHSFCQYVARDRAPLVVADAREHPVLKFNPAVSELGAIAYAGMPLMIQGEAIGALCVVNDSPREWSDEQVRLLRDLADSVVSEIELRIALRAAEEQRAVTAALVDGMGDVVLAIDAQRRFLIVNEAARGVFRRAEVGKPLPGDWTQAHRSRKLDGSPLPSEEGAMVRGLAGLSTDGLTFTLQAPGVDEPVWLETTGRPVRDSDGNVVAAVAIYRNVTERTRQADRYRALAGNIPSGAVALFDRDLRCLAVDGVIIREAGLDPQRLLGRPMRTLARAGSGAELDAVEDIYRRTLAGEAVNHDFAVNDRVIELHTAPVRDELGRIAGGLVLGLDRTDERYVAAALRHNEQLYRAIVQHLPNGAVLIIDRELRYVAADGPIVGDLLRAANLSELVGRKADEVSSPALRDSLLETYRAALRGEARNREVSRGDRHFDLRTVPIFDGDQVTHAMIFLYDVSDRRREAEELRRVRDQVVGERALFEATLAHIDDGVVLLDGQRRLLLANDAMAAMFGFDQGEMRGLNTETFVAHITGQLEDPAGSAARLLSAELGRSEEFVFTRPRRRVLRRSSAPVRLPGQDGLLITWHDITSDKALLAEREHQLLIDALTGIANRRAAETALKVEHGRMRRTGVPMSVAVFDIDHFKRVNDTYGHATGDRVLCQVAAVIASEARVTDVVARWGGEEFIAVLPGPLAGARAFCERTRASIERLVCPSVGRVTTSVGVAELGPDEDPAAAIARADELLYEAKRRGRNRVIG